MAPESPQKRIVRDLSSSAPLLNLPEPLLRSAWTAVLFQGVLCRCGIVFSEERIPDEGIAGRAQVYELGAVVGPVPVPVGNMGEAHVAMLVIPATLNKFIDRWVERLATV